MITFDESVKDFLLDSLGIKTDKEGYLCDEKGRIKTGDGELLFKDEWVGYVEGYGHVKGDISGLISLSDWADGKIADKVFDKVFSVKEVIDD